MNVLIVDSDKCGLDFAIRAALAGHDVKLFRWTKKPSRYGEGFPAFLDNFELVDSWGEYVDWAKEGLIFSTGNNRYLSYLDRLRDAGYPVFAPTVQSARLEISRQAGMDLMESTGIRVPPYTTLGSLQEAEAFARKNDRPFVFKPMGDDDDKAMTYVSSDPADLVGWLRRQIAQGKVLKGPCMLQEKVEKLSEIGVSGWFGPDGFLPDKWQICFEHKPLFPGDIGPNTGEQGTVCQYVASDQLAEDMLEPLVPTLRALGHRGDFAIGAIVDEKGDAYALEFTARCGYPAWWIQAASHRGDPVKWMKDLLDGKDSLRVSNDVAIGVVVAQPQYPYDTAPADMVEGTPIQGWENSSDLHPVEVMVGKGPQMDGDKVTDMDGWQTAGEYVLVATGLGKTVQKAQKRVYGTIDGIKFPSMMYRQDIGDRLEDELPALHKFGYAVDTEF